jgi:hypothetical protein
VQSGEEILGQLEGMVFGDESAGMANKDKMKKKEEGRIGRWEKHRLEM